MARLSNLVIAVALVGTTAMSPVTRVSELLKELSAKVENDGKTEETGGGYRGTLECGKAGRGINKYHRSVC